MKENSPAPKKNIFLYILPYLLMGVAVFLMIWYFISMMMGKSVAWNVSELDSFLALDDTSSYYIGQVTSSASYNAVNVSGVAVEKVAKTDQSKGTFSFTVTIDLEQWNHSWETKDAAGVVTFHDSYVRMFQQKVDEWNADETLVKRFGQGSYVVKDAFQQSWWDVWGPTIIMIGIVTIIGIIFFAKLSGSVNGANRQAMDFNKSPARREDSGKVRFRDVAGCDEEKAEMVELVEYLKDPKKYSKFGARLPKGVLLIGPPGTGKTLLAKSVAGEAGVPFYSISGSDFVEMFVGVGAGRVRDLFKRAKQTAPCLIFIDEIDAVGRQRGAGMGGGNDEREQTLNQLLVEMDGFDSNAGILVIAATNRDDVLDPALMRAGRFDRTITVNLPDRAGREAIFKVHARNKKIDPSVDFGALARRTVGFSGADIENILNEAAILAVRANSESITLPEIDEAIDRRIAGPAKTGKGMSEEERREVAYHEAGHAIIGLSLPYSDKVQKITIIPRGRTGGHVLMTPDDDRFLLTKKQLLARITGLLGGRSSEEVFFDDISTGAENDIQEATRMARLMVTEFGMSDLGPIQYEKNSSSVFLGRDYGNVQKNFSTQIAYEIDQAVRQIIDDAHKQAVDLITLHKEEVKLIAETLLQKETITAEEIQQLVSNGKLEQVETGKVVQTTGLEEKVTEEVKEQLAAKKVVKKATTKKAASKKPTTKKTKEAAPKDATGDK